MTPRFYAGIGSRQTPLPICERMTLIATRLKVMGYVLRSGGANGADKAFEAGAGAKEIFRPNDVTEEALELAARFHPAWHRCDASAKALHARNGFQILGRDLKTPSEFVVCWTEGGKLKGGTSQALRIAQHYAIPIYNLAIPGDYPRLFRERMNQALLPT